MSYQQFTTRCACGALTSKSYARSHGGKCKACFTGVPKALSDPEAHFNHHPLLCPDCRTNLLTPYQKAHHYHCDACTRAADPVGYYNEVMGLSENMGGGDY